MLAPHKIMHLCANFDDDLWQIQSFRVGKPLFWYKKPNIGQKENFLDQNFIEWSFIYKSAFMCQISWRFIKYSWLYSEKKIFWSKKSNFDPKSCSSPIISFLIFFIWNNAIVCQFLWRFIKNSEFYSE